MAKVLESFLIGVGLDTEDYDKGAKKVDASLGRMRSLVGFTGAAIVGAFSAAGAAAIAAGQRIDDLRLATEGLKTSPSWVYAYGEALEALNGDAENALAAIKAIESAQADFSLKGMLGPLEDVALTGADISALTQTTSGAEFLRTLAPMVQNMTKEQQNLTQRTLGLTDDVMQSLRGGVDALDAQVARASNLLGSGFEGATEAARAFNKELAEFGTRTQGISDTLAGKLLPGFTGILESVNGFIDNNRSAIEGAADLAAKSPTGAALATAGGLSSFVGAAAKGVGLRGLGAGLSRLGGYGLALGAPLMAWDARPEDIENLTGWKPSSYIFDNTPLDAARDAYNWAADKLGFGESSEPEYPVEPEPLVSDWLPLNQVNYADGYQPPQITESPTSGFVRPYEDIYGGGEVSNQEVAQVSRDIAVHVAQQAQPAAPVITPRIRVDNHLEANLTLDGRALEAKMTDVIERRERMTQDDIISSVNR